MWPPHPGETFSGEQCCQGATCTRKAISPKPLQLPAKLSRAHCTWHWVSQEDQENGSFSHHFPCKEQLPVFPSLVTNLVQRVSDDFNVHFIQVLLRYAVLEEGGWKGREGKG